MMERDETLRLARRYAAAYEALTPGTIPALTDLAAANVRFSDPFNEFRGRDRLAAVFRHMFDGLTAPAFAVTDVAVGEAGNENVAYLRWRFTFLYRQRPHTIDGVSEVHFDGDGLVSVHLDHWDSATQVYMHVPILGRLIAAIRRRLAG
ncbi:nuclear transport factor 2 family protein [Fodinicurvata sp. EGI_FJ10296]|jgi:hypothetical protein|uniref:nuclear transport factor 2 family protein n=1 Tax=Fodinicurvata sp. EGI_FJ10296 TaxID=3231908 RepID=UPI003456EA57